MRAEHLISVLLIALLAGCSGNNSGGSGGGGGGGGSGGGGSGGGGGGAGGGGAGGGGSGGAGGGGGTSTDIVTIQTQPFNVVAGGEVFMCQDFANPFGGTDTEVDSITSTMTPGSHHMLLFFQSNASNTNVASCPALQFQPMLYGAQQPQVSLQYPAGVAALIKGSQGFHMQMHYLNVTPADINAQVTITFHKAAAGTITQHAGVFFFNNVSGVNVPPNTTTDIRASCSFGKDVNVIFGVAHTHQFTNTFSASIGNNTIYSTTSWDNSPNQAYSPPLAVPSGTSLSWNCNVTNPPNGPNPLTFCESAKTCEMCIFDGQYYPADDNNPTVECMK